MHESPSSNVTASFCLSALVSPHKIKKIKKKVRNIVGGKTRTSRAVIVLVCCAKVNPCTKHRVDFWKFNEFWRGGFAGKASFSESFFSYLTVVEI